MQKVFAALVFLFSIQPLFAWELRIFYEFFRPAPARGLVAVDWEGNEPSALKPGDDGAVHLTAFRGGYVSIHLAISDAHGGTYRLTAESSDPGIEIDLFREWFHRKPGDGGFYPDALIPVGSEKSFRLPDPEMKIPKQKTAVFWLDVWVPSDTRPGTVSIELKLDSPGATTEQRIALRVLEAVIPSGDVIVADHNTYGLSWVQRYFQIRKRSVESGGGRFEGSVEFMQSIHDAYRILYEHRALLHDLGYGHTGQVNPLFAPVLEGEGDRKRIASWDLFDRHFGSLLDGSAFEGTRRGARPIEFLYLTINPEWPADYIDWGSPGYESQFVNVISEMERHFVQKGWTSTNFEMFFNHKKRYKGFAWDGDETRFPKDDVAFKEFARLLHQAVPEDSPVSFVFRHDASWLMRRQMDDLAGAVNFWVCSAGVLSLYPEVPEMLRRRGDVIWIYGGSPSHFDSTLAVLDLPLRAWIQGLDGFVRWLTTAPGDDPWFNSNGGRTAMFFPAERFGLNQPIPSIRLKIQRNILQDLALLEELGSRLDPEEVRTAVAMLAGGSSLRDWWNGEASIKNAPPWEWSNASLRSAATPPVRELRKLDGRWWLAVRDYLNEHKELLATRRMSGQFKKPTTRRTTFQKYRPAVKVNPRLPNRRLKGEPDEQLMEIARLASRSISGEVCRRIITARAKQWLFRKHPEDQWFAMDNYDVNHLEFIKIKKELIGLSQLATFSVDCNLWLQMEARPETVMAVIRQVNDWSQWYRFGQMTIPLTVEMKRVLQGETVVVRGVKEGLTSVLAPVRDGREIVGFVEVCSRIGEPGK